MESTISYQKPNEPNPPEVIEPFGQAGIRQYVGRVLLWFLITCLICSCGMWYRSLSYSDRIDWRGDGDMATISTIAGRIWLAYNNYDGNRVNNSGWSYSGGEFDPSRIEDRWKNSVYKVIGIELSLTPENIGRGPRAVSGMWIRIKWYFVTGVFGFLLLLHLLLTWRNTREAASA